MSNIQKEQVSNQQELCDISISSNIYVKKKAQKEKQELNNHIQQNQYSTKMESLPQIPALQKPIMTNKKKKSINLGQQLKNEISIQKKGSQMINTYDKKQKQNQKEDSLNQLNQGQISNQVQILYSRVNQLQKNHQIMEQKFIKSIKQLQEDLAKRDQRNKNMRNQIQSIKKDLSDRRNDINFLKVMIQDEGNIVNQYNDYNNPPENRNLLSPQRDIGKKTGSGFKQKKQLYIPPSRKSPNMKQKNFSKFY